MGVAIRTNNTLSLDLPSIVWKPLVSRACCGGPLLGLCAVLLLVCYPDDVPSVHLLLVGYQPSDTCHVCSVCPTGGSAAQGGRSGRRRRNLRQRESSSPVSSRTVSLSCLQSRVLSNQSAACFCFADGRCMSVLVVCCADDEPAVRRHPAQDQGKRSTSPAGSLVRMSHSCSCGVRLCAMVRTWTRARLRTTSDRPSPTRPGEPFQSPWTADALNVFAIPSVCTQPEAHPVCCAAVVVACACVLAAISL